MFHDVCLLFINALAVRLKGVFGREQSHGSVAARVDAGDIGISAKVRCERQLCTI
jgi:hypothetical protein